MIIRKRIVEVNFPPLLHRTRLVKGRIDTRKKEDAMTFMSAPD
jgi:hypothetical protein